MSNWSEETEEELTLLLKDWLKHHGRTQADLRQSLQSDTTRMPSLIEALKKDFVRGGMPQIASRLCSIEENWYSKETDTIKGENPSDPFGQLDLLLEELRQDCDQ